MSKQSITKLTAISIASSIVSCTLCAVFYCASSDEQQDHTKKPDIKLPPQDPETENYTVGRSGANTTIDFNASSIDHSFNIQLAHNEQNKKSVESVNEEKIFQRFIDHLIDREGSKNVVYEDSEGHLTVGVGHLVTKADNLKLGDRISDEKVKEFLRKDARKAFTAAQSQAKEADISSPDFIVALGSVNFQLGTGWRSKFKKTWALIKDGKYEEAANRLQNTKWNAQTPVRVKDFQEALRDLAGKTLSFHPRVQPKTILGYSFNGAAIADPTVIEAGQEVTAIDIRNFQPNGASVLKLEVA